MIGNYSECSYNANGTGTFNASPKVQVHLLECLVSSIMNLRSE
jgi:hypothetical protein